jgi:hypothetical protein
MAIRYQVGVCVAFVALLTLAQWESAAASCSPTPLSGCVAATKAQLLLKHGSSSKQDKLTFKFKGGVGVPHFNLSEDFDLCIYAPGLVLQGAAVAGPNWSLGAGQHQSYLYQDPSGAVGGVTKVKLHNPGGGVGTTKILFKGGGANLDDPLPLTQPVLVQVQDGTIGVVSMVNNCWEHQFSSPQIKSSATLFKDKEP